MGKWVRHISPSARMINLLLPCSYQVGIRSCTDFVLRHEPHAKRVTGTSCVNGTIQVASFCMSCGILACHHLETSISLPHYYLLHLLIS